MQDSGPITLYDANGLPIALGQALKAASLPVTLASDQGPLVSQLQGYSYNSYSPDPSNIPTTNQTPLAIDAAGRLEVHSTNTSDEGSFRDDFAGATLAVALTGTVAFVNGASTLSGVGTLFTTQVVVGQWLKKTTDGETFYARVNTVNSDTQLQVDTPYGGTTATVAGVISNWNTVTAATGGAITVAASVCSIASGTANGQSSYIQRKGDYGPFTRTIYASVSQRIANQTASIGFRDAWAGTLGRAEVQFTGTVNTQVNFVTSQDGTLQTTTVTLPNGGTTNTQHSYKIDISGNKCCLTIDGVTAGMPKHDLHIPAPYQGLSLFHGITNAAAVTSTTLAIDCDYFYNTDRTQIDDDFAGEALPVALANDATQRQRVAIIFQAVAPATADTALSLTKSTNGVAAAGATSIAHAAGRTLRITSMTFSVKAGAAAAAFATFQLHINPAGAATNASQSEFRVDLGNTENVIGAARAITVPIPDGLDISGTAQLCVSASAQAVTNVLSVTLTGYEI